MPLQNNWQTTIIKTNKQDGILSSSFEYKIYNDLNAIFYTCSLLHISNWYIRFDIFIFNIYY